MLVNGNYESNYFSYQNTNRQADASEQFDVEKLLGEEETEAAVEPKTDYNQKALEFIGANAPECVKQAWLEAAEEVGVNGFGMLPNGMLSHISQLQMQRGLAWMRGEEDCGDVLGTSVASAISAVQKALYDLDHPLEPNAVRSLEVQQARMKEREFYAAFLEKLEQ